MDVDGSDNFDDGILCTRCTSQAWTARWVKHYRADDRRRSIRPSGHCFPELTKLQHAVSEHRGYFRADCAVTYHSLVTKMADSIVQVHRSFHHPYSAGEEACVGLQDLEMRLRSAQCNLARASPHHGWSLYGLEMDHGHLSIFFPAIGLQQHRHFQESWVAAIKPINCRLQLVWLPSDDGRTCKLQHRTLDDLWLSHCLRCEQLFHVMFNAKQRAVIRLCCHATIYAWLASSLTPLPEMTVEFLVRRLG